MKSLKEKIQSVVDIYKSGNLLEAEQVCIDLINENSKVPFLYNLLGLILVGQKKFVQAIKYYELGLKIDPTFAIIYNNLGLLFFDQQTEESIKKALKNWKSGTNRKEKIHWISEIFEKIPNAQKSGKSTKNGRIVPRWAGTHDLFFL